MARYVDKSLYQKAVRQLEEARKRIAELESGEKKSEELMRLTPDKYLALRSALRTVELPCPSTDPTCTCEAFSMERFREEFDPPTAKALLAELDRLTEVENYLSDLEGA